MSCIILLGITVSTTGTANTFSAMGDTGQTVTVPYSGQLTTQDGKALANGFYDFIFRVYDAHENGTLLWMEHQSGIQISGGNLSVNLGSITAIPGQVMESQSAWLDVSVRGPGETQFTSLSPRVNFIPFLAPVALTCPHSHYGDSWTGTGSYDGLMITNDFVSRDALHVVSDNTDTNHGAIYARNEAPTGTGDAINALSYHGVGLRASSGSLDGVDASTSGVGKSAVYAHTTTGWGVAAVSGAVGSAYPNNFAASKGEGTAADNAGGKFIGEQYLGATVTTNQPLSWYGLLVDGGIYLMNGSCSGCALAYIGMNSGGDDIQIGDLVAATGVQVDAATNQPILQVKRATSADDVIIGVSIGPAASPTDPGRKNPETPGNSGPGVTAAGEYVNVIVSGLAQARLASDANLSIGDYIIPGSSGAELAKDSAEGVARVMDLPVSNGLVWVMLISR